MILRSGFVCLGLLVLSALFTKSAAADRMEFSNVTYPSYFIDQNIQTCARSLKKYGYVVLAYSPGGASTCVYGDRGFEKANRKQALDECNGNRSGIEAQLTKCRIVMENGKIFDSKFYNSQRRDARSPVDIEIYDGKTNQLSRTTGFISSGRWLSGSTVEVKLTTGGGAVLCRGVTRYSGSSARYDATCFEKFKFSGKVPEPSGFSMYEGQFVQHVSVKLQHEKSYISIAPRD